MKLLVAQERERERGRREEKNDKSVCNYFWNVATKNHGHPDLLRRVCHARIFLKCSRNNAVIFTKLTFVQNAPGAAAFEKNNNIHERNLDNGKHRSPLLRHAN